MGGTHEKYNERILDIKRGQASIFLNSITYNSRIVPVMSYVAQLVPRPETFQERYGMLSVLRCSNCMRHSDFFELHKLGGPKLRSIEVSCAVAHCGNVLRAAVARAVFCIKVLRFIKGF